MRDGDVMVFPRHIRACSICTRGARGWFKARNLDYNKFVADGMPGDEMLAQNDTFGDQVVAAAFRERDSG